MKSREWRAASRKGSKGVVDGGGDLERERGAGEEKLIKSRPKCEINGAYGRGEQGKALGYSGVAIWGAKMTNHGGG